MFGQVSHHYQNDNLIFAILQEVDFYNMIGPFPVSETHVAANRRGQYSVLVVGHLCF